MEHSTIYGIDINAKDNAGMTAFMCACHFGKTSIVEHMLAYTQAHPQNLDLTIKHKFGKTGFQLAKSNRKSDVVTLITNKMPSLVI